MNEKQWGKDNDPEDYLTNYLREERENNTWTDVFIAGGITGMMAFLVIIGLLLIF